MESENNLKLPVTLSEVLALVKEVEWAKKFWWQTMESSPKDGSEFLACINFSKTKRGDIIGGDIHITRYDNIDNKFRRRGGFTFIPTHWMPLPKPLSLEAKNGK
jgi:hypothetical protein